MSTGGRRAALLHDLQQSLRVISLESRRYVGDVARSMHVPISDVHAVGVLKDARDRGEDVTASTLGQRVGLSAAAVTAMVDRMTRVGHATRERSTVDARRVVVEATDLARDESAHMFAPMNQSVAEAMAGYSDAELTTAVKVLSDLADAMTTTREVPDRP